MFRKYFKSGFIKNHASTKTRSLHYIDQVGFFLVRSQFRVRNNASRQVIKDWVRNLSIKYIVDVTWLKS